MRGSPPLHLVLLLLGFCVVAFPLQRLTFGRPKPKPMAGHESANEETSPTASKAAFLTIRFAHAPKALAITHLGVALGTYESDQTSPLEWDVTLPDFGSSLELSVAVSWPEGTPESALSLTIEPDGMESRESTLWGRESVNTTTVFSWDA